MDDAVRTILVVSHVIPYPPAAGNEIRIWNMLKWIKSQGLRIVLLLNHSTNAIDADRKAILETVVDVVHFIDENTGDPCAEVKRGNLVRLREKLALSLPDSFPYRALFGMEKPKKIKSDRVKRYLASDALIHATRYFAERYRPSVVLAEYIFAAPCLDVAPADALKIIDTIDMFSRKEQQVLAYGIDDPLPCTRREERAFLLKCDLVIAIQSYEARMFKKLVPERKVITVGIDYDVVSAIDNSGVVDGTILVVGSDNALNRHGLNEFYKHAWPSIKTGSTKAVLRIVGALGNHLDTDDLRIQKRGWVANLDEEYRQAAVVINPTLAGTGLKIKSVEAMCHAKPLVGTRNGVEGIDYSGTPPFIVCDDWQHFSAAVLGLIESPDQRLRLQQVAFEYARDHFNSAKIYAPLAGLLEHGARAPRHTPSRDR